jgi:hypothetical protein
MHKNLTIVYITCRREPMFQWFVETLISQYPDGVVTDQIIFIDSFIHHEEGRTEKLAKIVNGRFGYTHTPPKPSIWRGKYRKTKSNFFDASATRNTGIILAENEHIVFVDDLSALADGWLSYHRKAAEDKVILCGAYDKVSDIVISSNKIVSYNSSNFDNRGNNQIGNQNLKIGGGGIFGQNVSFPFEFLERVNGYDEFFARRGCEDCNLGIRLEIAGYADSMFYNKNCLIIEDKAMHWNEVNCVDEFYAKRSFKTDHQRHQEVADYFCKIMNDLENKNLYVDKNFKTIDTSFNLKEERELWQRAKEFKPVGDCDYFDFDGENLNQI